MDKLRSRLLAGLVVILFIAAAGVLYSFVGGFGVPESGSRLFLSTYLPGIAFLMLLIFAMLYFEKF